jgi:hypothetical protein
MPVPSESRDHRSAQRRRETPSAPALTRQRDRERGNRADQGARLIRGIGQKSVVRIFGSSISLASKDVRGATGGPSDDSSHATCDTFAYRYRKMSVFDAPRGGSSEGEGASRTGARFGRPWGQSHCLSGPVSAQVLSARHDGTRPAHAPCGLTRFMEWELDSRRSDWPESAQADAPAQEAAVWQSDPKRAVPARMTMDARGRTRPSEAPPARWRGGSTPEPKAPPAGTS